MQMILDSQIWAKPETEPKIYNLYKTSKSKKVKKCIFGLEVTVM